jgi:hypothetical protein
MDDTYRHRALSLYGDTEVEVPASAEKVIRDELERCPQAWTARLVWEDLREAGHDDISEQMVAQVMGR